MDQEFLYDLLVRPFWDNYQLILLSCVCCQLIQWGTDFLSSLIFPTYKTLSAEKRLDWCVRVVSMFHALSAMCLIPGFMNPEPSLATFDEGTSQWTYFHFGFSAESQFFYSISVGYFLWDTIICIYYRWGFEFLIHGVLCFLAYYCCLYPFQHYWGRFYLGVYEISTIPLHIRGCMKLIDVDHRIFLFVQTLWVISYTICRIFLGAYYTWIWWLEINNLLVTDTCRSPYLCYFFIFINFSMMALMWYWWSLIIKGLLGIGRQNDRQNAEQHYVKLKLSSKEERAKKKKC